MKAMRAHESHEGGLPLEVCVLVVGDAAVGKTSEEMSRSSSCLCSGEWKAASQVGEWTCGCTVPLVRQCIEADLRSVDTEVELWEVGGTQTCACARPVFHESLDAVLCVYDVSNMQSYHNLVVSLFELCTSAWAPSLRYWDPGGGSGGVPDADLERCDGHMFQQAILSGRCPVLFVANKCDLKEGCNSGITGRFVGLPWPCPPFKPPLLDRLLVGESNFIGCKTAADRDLVERLCDFVLQSRHTEAISTDACTVV